MRSLLYSVDMILILMYMILIILTYLSSSILDLHELQDDLSNVTDFSHARLCTVNRSPVIDLTVLARGILSLDYFSE